ncbi:MAG: CotH kinase family protein [Lachnospiraceae bacterium]|nr:CotH kinase family protein [Lachnospiraceae bacterium]
MRKRAGILIWTGILMVALVTIWLFTAGQSEETAATGYNDLKLELKHRAYKENITLWEAEDGAYYCFLPSGWKEGKLVFNNIGRGDSIFIGDTTYESGDNLNQTIEMGTEYSMQLKVAGNLAETETIIFKESANLPTLFVTTETGNMDFVHSSKENKEGATITLIDENGRLLCSDDLEYIKARGNSTFEEAEKKSYQIKFEEELSVLGMPKAKKWVLFANALDNSLIRNQLVYQYAADYTEVPSMEGKYVDLYLNGEYAGNYFLCERIEVAPERVNIVDLEAKNEVVNDTKNLDTWEKYLSPSGDVKAVAGMKNPEDITGGYLVELADKSEYPTYRSAFCTEAGNYFHIISPENASVEQVEYIRNLFNEMECAIMQENGIHPDTGKHFTEYLDMDSWTSKHLIEEVFHNPDGPEGSCYFYKDIDSVSPLIQVGPVWDYDRAMGGYERWAMFDQPRQIGNLSKYADYLMKHETVQEMVAEKFEKDMLPYMEEVLAADVDKWTAYLETSAELDSIRWPYNGGYYVGREAEWDYIKLFLQEKTEFLKECWLEDALYHEVLFLDIGGSASVKYMVKHGEKLSEVPVFRYDHAIFNGFTCVETGEKYNANLPILEDRTYQSDWIMVSTLLENGYNMTDIDPEQVDLEALEMLVEEMKRQQSQTVTNK